MTGEPGRVTLQSHEIAFNTDGATFRMSDKPGSHCWIKGDTSVVVDLEEWC